MIDAARAKGIDVRADQYAYTAASSGLGIRFPSWVLEGGRVEGCRTSEHARPPGRRSSWRWPGCSPSAGCATSHSPSSRCTSPTRRCNGLSMQQIASRQKGSDSADAQFEVAREMLLDGGAQMVYHFMSDDDVDRIMRHPQVSIASDSGLLVFGDGVPHPRGYGDNARVLGTYVRTRHVIALEEAIRKMTSLPAAHFKLANRGIVKTGYAADLVVFDARTVADAATYRRAARLRDGHPLRPGERRGRRQERHADGCPPRAGDRELLAREAVSALTRRAWGQPCGAAEPRHIRSRARPSVQPETKACCLPLKGITEARVMPVAPRTPRPGADVVWAAELTAGGWLGYAPETVCAYGRCTTLTEMSLAEPSGEPRSARRSLSRIRATDCTDQTVSN